MADLGGGTRRPGRGPRPIEWCALLACLVAPTLAAQPASAAPQDSTPPPPRAIPADSIPDRAFAAQAWLAGLSGTLPADSVLRRLDATLARIRMDYTGLAARTSPPQLDVMYLDDLADLAATWGQLERRLGAWRRRISPLTERVEAAHDTLTRFAERWRLTSAAAGRDMPAAVRAQVVTVRASIDSAQRAVRPHRERLQSLEAEGAQLDVDVTARVDDVRAAEDRARLALLRQDSPVLWRVFGGADTAATAAIDTPGRFEAAVDYLERHAGRLRLHAMLFVAAFLVLWFVGRRRSAWTTTEFALHWPSSLLAHPVAAGWLLALSLTRTIHPDAPRGVYGLGFLLLVPALVILLRQLLNAHLRAPAYALVALYAFRVVADTFDWHPTTARLVLVGLAVVGLAVLAWFARLLPTVAPGTASDRRWRAIGRALAYAGGGLLAAAAVANVFGFVTLADLLVMATLASGLVALAFIALADVAVGALLVLLFATPVGGLAVIRRNRGIVHRRVTAVVHGAGLVAWGVVTLRQFRLWGPVSRALGGALTTPLHIGSWNFSAGDVLLFAATSWLAIYLARGLRAVLREDVLARMPLDRGIPDAVASIAYYLVLALGLVFALGAAGIDFSRLAFVAGALGVGIGFGLQSIVANFISGLILLFERPIKSGDTVELENLRGVVQRIGIRASTVRTFQGSEVIVPNQDLVVSRVINWTLSDQTRRVEIPIGVAYGSDPEQVMAIIQQAATGLPHVLEQPPVTVLFTGYGESSLDFELRLWARTDRWYEARSDALVAVYRAFATHGIEIPFPQRDLHLRSVDRGAGDALRPPSTS